MSVIGRVVLGAIAVGFLGALSIGQAPPPPAEALSRLQARISWETSGATQDDEDGPRDGLFRCDTLSWSDSLPRSLRERSAGDTSAYALWRGTTLSRQSNPSPDGEQVLTSPLVTCFADIVEFTPSRDVEAAVIRVHQPTYGQVRRGQPPLAAVMVRAERITPLGIAYDGPGVALELDSIEGAPALPAGVPVRMTIFSRVPPESQCDGLRPTPRIFTSMIRVMERYVDPRLPTPESSPTPSPTPNIIPNDDCHFTDHAPSLGPLRGLRQPMTIRIQLQRNEWAQLNGRPTPTPIVVR